MNFKNISYSEQKLKSCMNFRIQHSFQKYKKKQKDALNGVLTSGFKKNYDEIESPRPKSNLKLN